MVVRKTAASSAGGRGNAINDFHSKIDEMAKRKTDPRVA
jgi:hypothetical protein